MAIPLWLKNICLALVDTDEELLVCSQELKRTQNAINDLHTQYNELLTLKNNIEENLEHLEAEYDVLEEELEASKFNVYEEILNKKYNKVHLSYTKRWALKDNKMIKMDIRDFVSPRKTLKTSTTVEKIWREKIKYVFDDYAYNGVLDVWQLPEETMVLKAGDCDDSGAYRLSKAKACGLGDNLFAALGFIGNIGHFFIVRLEEDGEVYVLENTSNSYDPKKYKNSEYKICYLFNENFVWEVDGSFNFGKLSSSFNITKR